MAFCQGINEVIDCCHFLECDKATERKRNAERLESLLKQDSIVECLSGSSHLHKDINYTMIFKFVQGHLLKETEIIRKKSNSVLSVTTIAEQKMQYCSKLLRLVVSAANKDAPNIKCQDLVDSVLQILNEMFYFHFYGSTYLDLWINYVWKHHKYIQNISSSDYKNFINICVKLFNNDKIDRHMNVQLLMVLKHLIVCIIHQCNASQHLYLFDFLKNTTKIIMKHSSKAIDYYFWCLYRYTEWQFNASTDMVLNLGVHTLPTIIPNLVSKTVIGNAWVNSASYCLLFVRFHCHSDWPSDQMEYWHDIFKQLFLVLYQKLSLGENQTPIKQKLQSKSILLSDSVFIDLASALLHVFLKSNKDFILLESDAVSSLTQRNGLKVSSLHLLFSSAFCANQEIQNVWLKVLHAFFESYPNDLKKIDTTVFVKTLNEVLSNKHSSDLLHSAFQLLATLMDNCVFKEVACKTDFSLWPQLWEVSKQQAFSINPGLSQLCDIAFQVMSLIITFDTKCKFLLLKDCDIQLSNLWPLLRFSVKPSTGVLLFLASCVKENRYFSAGKQYGMMLDSQCKAEYSLQLTILDWLLGCREFIVSSEAIQQQDSDNDPIICKVPNLFKDISSEPPNAELVSKLVCCLCCINFNVNTTKVVDLVNEDAHKLGAEKVLISNLCKHVEKLCRLLLSAADNNLLQSAVNLKKHSAEQALYGILLVTYISTSLKNGLDFQLINSLLIKSIEVIETLSYDDPDDLTKILDYSCLLVLHLIGFPSDYLKLKLGLLKLKKLTFFLLDQLFLSGNGGLPLNDSLTGHDTSLSYGQDVLNLTQGTQIEFQIDKDLASPPSKRARSSYGLFEHKSVTSVSNPKKPQQFAITSEKLLQLLKSLSQVLNNGISSKEILDHFVLNDKFSPSQPNHVDIFVLFLKMFSKSFSSLCFSDVKLVISAIKNILRQNYKDLHVYKQCLEIIPSLLKQLLFFPSNEDINECFCQMMSCLNIIEKLISEDHCNDEVKSTFIYCLAELSTICPLGPHSKDQHLNKQSICSKYVDILADENLFMVMKCAKHSQKLFQINGSYSATDMSSFLNEMLMKLEKVGHQLLDAMFRQKNAVCKALCYVQSYLQTLWGLPFFVDYSIECAVAYETCYFAASAHQGFTLDKQALFFEMMHNVRIYIENSSCFSTCASKFYLAWHLKFIIWKWPGGKLENFPYYLFAFASLKEFLHYHVEVVLPILIYKCFLEGRELRALFSWFDTSQLIAAVPVFAGIFLSSYYGKSNFKTSSKNCTFRTAWLAMQQMHDYASPQVSLSGSLTQQMPITFNTCLYYFSLNHLSFNFAGGLPLVLDEAALQNCLSTLLQFYVSKKFVHNSEKFNLELLLKFLNGKPGVLQVFLLNLRKSLLFAGNIHEHHRLILVFSFICEWLTNPSSNQVKYFKEISTRVAISTTILQVNELLEQMFSAQSCEVILQMIVLTTSYIQLLLKIFNSAFEDKACVAVLNEDDVIMQVSSAMSYISRIIFLKHSVLMQMRPWKKLLETFDKFLKFIIQSSFLNETYRVLIFALLDRKTGLQKCFQNFPWSKDIAILLIEVILKTIKAKPSNQAYSWMVENLTTCLTHTLSVLNSSELFDLQSAFKTFYIDLALLPVSNVNLQIELAKCFETLSLKPVSASFFLQGKQQERHVKEPIEETLTALYAAYLTKDINEAKTALTCLLNISQCDEMQKLFKTHKSFSLSFSTFQFISSCFSSSSKSTCSTTISVSEMTMLNEQELWSCYQSNYDEWICSSTLFLIQMCNADYLCCMLDICKLSPLICHHILPHVVLLLLVGKNSKTVINFLNGFFTSVKERKDEKLNETVVKRLLKIIEYIREQFRCGLQNGILCYFLPNTEYASKELAKSLKSIDFLSVAEAAIFCRDATAALLYLETWIESVLERNSSQFSRISSYQGTKCLLEIVQNLSASGKRAGELAVAVFTMLNETEAVRGCFAVTSSVAFSHSSIFEKEDRWLDALQSNDLKNFGKSNSNGKVFQCLQECGFDHIGTIYAKSFGKSFLCGSEFEEICFKSAWKQSQWDNSLCTDLSSSDSFGFHKTFFTHLRSLHYVQPRNFNFTLKKLRATCINALNLQQGQFLNTDHLNHAIVQLECFKETQKVFELVKSGTLLEEVVDSWKKPVDQFLDVGCSYSNLGLLTSTQSALLDILNQKVKLKIGNHHANVLEIQASHCLLCIDIACRFTRFQHAEQYWQRLNETVNSMHGCAGKLPRSTAWWQCRSLYEFAVLRWKRSDKTLALSSLRSLLKDFQLGDKKGSWEIILLADMMQTAAQWFDELKFEGASVIINDYLKPSTERLDKLFQVEPRNEECRKRLVASHLMLARFADKQLQEVMSYKSSGEFSLKYNLASASKAEKEQAGQSLSKKTEIIIAKNLNIDKQEQSQVEEKELNFLLTALRSYMRCLQLSDENDFLLHRVCSLWFDHQLDPQVHACMQNGHKKLPSYKYVCLCYQLAARLSKANPDCSYSLLVREILARVITDHPHQTLSVILALVNAYKDDNVHNKSTSTGNMKNSPIELVLEAVRSKRSHLVAASEVLAETYIELANYDAAQWKNKPMQQINFPKHLSINQLCNAQTQQCKELSNSNLVIPVCELPIDKRACYDKIPASVIFSHFKQGFQTCGGINLPKVVIAVAADGKEKKHLVKGRDDLRQDAVMQQVFQMVNDLLVKSSKHKELTIRVYKVVPLTQQSGLVEWCIGTIPIGSYLVGNQMQKVLGAHQKFRPNDLPVISCRKKLQSVARRSLAEKHKMFLDICKVFLPIFRKFFIEKFPYTLDWYLRKRSYTQSVAVSSMVGYMLGLGDRHVQNILVDTNTAEVIHIDLGVAFEQGRCLPTPETVPFRLSRDIVDGMGLTGVEGFFRKCCEQTMTILRNSFDVIIPILEVLLYDPLHDWTIPPQKATTKQKKHLSKNQDVSHEISQKSEHCTNKLAERALLRVKEKLRGSENGSALSVEGQVNVLIQHAMDPQRLCQLFAGWQPYL